MDNRKHEIKRSRRANRDQQRQPQPTEPRITPEEATEVHWLTPAAWSHPCSVCNRKGSIAFRYSDRSSVCDLCIDRLGLEVRESRAWRKHLGNAA